MTYIRHLCYCFANTIAETLYIIKDNMDRELIKQLLANIESVSEDLAVMRLRIHNMTKAVERSIERKSLDSKTTETPPNKD